MYSMRAAWLEECARRRSRVMRGIERLGEGDIGGVIGSDVVSQLPDPCDQSIVRMTTDRQVGEILECRERARHAEAFAEDSVAEAVNDLDIEEMRCMQFVIADDLSIRGKRLTSRRSSISAEASMTTICR